ncbi:hypothetical protein [Roseomonas xinghualingensis]|uniref:hypothetical protein n=1 Tax=Roseomonas xinghualingensis TaxID=2986475 RepID=UPI0021F1D61E|nr:hypothetical protein [Roseomonas sp. SXEYE001]MCV4206828.1 hypothetical protein [Roseomonas sp. SXEYE001]
MDPIESTAGLLAWARRGIALAGLPEEMRPGTIEAAEAIQTKTLSVLGSRIGGWKLGRHGGHVFSAPMPAVLPGKADAADVTLPAGSLIETEIAIRFNSTVEPGMLHAEALPERASIGILFEFVHGRFAPDAETGPLDRIADCVGNHGAAFRESSLTWLLEWLEAPPPVRLSLNGAVIAQHDGPHVAVPLRPLIDAWIARMQRENRGIRAGEVVTFGSLTGMLPIPAEGGKYTGEIEGLAPFHCAVAIAPAS